MRLRNQRPSAGRRSAQRPRSRRRSLRERSVFHHKLRHGLKMALITQQALVCVAALLLALSCARVDNTRTSNVAQASDGAPPDEFSAAAPVVLSPEDQTDNALAATRSADAAGRGGDGQLSQLTPQEHMRRAAIYQAKPAFEDARAHS